MSQIPVDRPTINHLAGDPGGTGEVVGDDPWGDLDDATYANAWTRKDFTTSFEHMLATIPPAVVAPGTVTVSLRISATASLSDALMQVNTVINLYPPGSPYGATDPPLNLADGISATHVKLPTYDGTVYDIPVSFYDWNYEVPATAEQVADYFAAGGTILCQPQITGGGSGTAQVTIHRLAFTADMGIAPLAYRRVFPRDDRRAYPPSKAYARGNRRGGGYL